MAPTPTRTDITEALLAVIMHSTEPMVLSDPHQADNPMVAANQAFERMTGFSQAETIGRNCRFLQGPATDADTARRIRSSVEVGQGRVEWIVNYRKNGAVFWNLLFISPVFDTDGKLLFFCGNQKDITEGAPAWLGEFPIGPVRMPEHIQSEFDALLAQILADSADVRAEPLAEARSRSLERIGEAARRVAFITTRLAPDDPA